MLSHVTLLNHHRLTNNMELEAFVIKIIPLKEKLQNFSRKITESDSDAEDIVQETFLKLWNMRDRLDEYNNAEALAMQMVKNLSIDKLRTKKYYGEEAEMMNISSGTKSPAELLEEKEIVSHIRQTIAGLPYLQQTIIRMKDIEGYELSEIAAITGSQIEAVRANLSRARKKVREHLSILHNTPNP